MQIINRSNWLNLETATTARLTALRNSSIGVNTLVTAAENAAPANVTGEIQDSEGGTGAHYDIGDSKVYLGADDIVFNPLRNYGIGNATAAANLPALATSECAEAVVYELLNWQAQADYKLYDRRLNDATMRPWERGLAYAEREAQVTYDHAVLMQGLINAGEVLSDFSARNIASTNAYVGNLPGYKALIANGPHTIPPGGQVTAATHLPTRLMYYYETFDKFGNSSALGKQLKGMLQLKKSPALAEAEEKSGLDLVNNWLKKSEFSDGLDRNTFPHFWAVMVSVVKTIAERKPNSFKLQSPDAEFSADMLRLAKNHPLSPQRLDLIQSELRKLTSQLKIGNPIAITSDGAK
ncbi:MAG: hypothetical protein H0T88_05670 [Lysobacter sp.]|nr:hypothetical protein [Lysobacter sp.]